MTTGVAREGVQGEKSPQSAPSPSDMRAWVVFSGQTERLWLRVLKRGFRHCFALLHDGTHWISFDPLIHVTDIQVQPVPADFDLPLWLSDQGYVVVPASITRRCDGGWSFPMPFTCVEAIRRVLGVRGFVVTPWHLYRTLMQTNPALSAAPFTQEISAHG